MIRFLLPLCLLSGAAFAQSAGDEARQARYESCLKKAQDDPDNAYEDALAWRMEGGGLPARHCVAVSLLALGETREAAERLEAIGHSSTPAPEVAKAEMLSQAGNAYLLAEAPSEARRALDGALKIQPGNPDLLIDRARALAMLDEYAEAESDLSAALEARGGDALALTLRAEARLYQGEIDAAEADAMAAIDADPENIDARLVLGNIRETRRTGEIPDW